MKRKDIRQYKDDFCIDRDNGDYQIVINLKRLNADTIHIINPPAKHIALKFTDEQARQIVAELQNWWEFDEHNKRRAWEEAMLKKWGKGKGKYTILLPSTSSK